MKDTIAKFKHYLMQRYPDRSTPKYYLSNLAIFSQFVGDKAPQDFNPKLIDDFVQTPAGKG